MGELLGQKYVEREFSAADKARVQALVGNLLAAFGSSIESLEWIGPETRAAAKAKLSTSAPIAGNTWPTASATVRSSVLMPRNSSSVPIRSR